MILQATLISRGYTHLVSPVRILFHDAPNPVKMLGKPTTSAIYSPFSLRQIIECILFLPLTFIVRPHSPDPHYSRPTNTSSAHSRSPNLPPPHRRPRRPSTPLPILQAPRSHQEREERRNQASRMELHVVRHSSVVFTIGASGEHVLPVDNADRERALGGEFGRTEAAAT